jgi:hypothetical protein
MVMKFLITIKYYLSGKIKILINHKEFSTSIEMTYKNIENEH